MAFRTKLVTFSILLLLVLSLTAAGLVHALNQRILERQVLLHMQDLAYHSMKSINFLLAKGLSDIQMIASDQVLRDRSASAQAITRRLIDYRNSCRTYTSLSVFDLQRVRLADTSGLEIGRALPAPAYWDTVVKGVPSVAGDIHDSVSLGLPVIYFAAPVFADNGTVRLVAVARMPASRIYELIGDISYTDERLDRHILLDLVDRDGLLLYSSHNQQGVLAHILSDWVAFRQSRGERLTGGGRHRHLNNEDMLYVFARQRDKEPLLGDQGWTLIMNVPSDVALAPARLLRNRLLLALLGICLLAGLASLLFATRLAQPVHLLSQAVARVGDGDLETRVPVTSHDEFGQFAQTFNRMVENLQRITASRDALNREIEHRQRAERELQLTQFSVDTAGDMIVWLDAAGQMVSVNIMACTLLGYTRRELLSLSVFTIDPDLTPRGWEKHWENRRAQYFTHLERMWQHKDGHLIPVEVRSHFIEFDGIEYECALVRDISERRQAEETLRQYMQELKRSNQDLEDFASIASHDLQEPLRGIAGFMHLLAKHYADQLDRQGRDYVERSILAAERLQTMIHDLLDYARITTRGEEFAACAGEAVLAAAMENLSASVHQSGAAVTHDPLPELTGDRSQLIRLFQNLLSNAIKFAGAAPPRIHISCQRTDTCWVLAFQDHGIGIEAEYQARIFNIFERLHTKEKYPGTGLGLAACKKIVQRHRGRIWLESAKGQGATFFVALPA